MANEDNIRKAITGAIWLLAAGLLWPAQGQAYCPLLASKMEQAVCDMEDRALWQQDEIDKLNNRVKEMEAAQINAEVRRSIAEDQRRRDDELRDLLGPRR